MRTQLEGDVPHLNTGGIMICDLCNSSSIDVDNGQNVCKNCGFVFEEKVYAYDSPQDKEINQSENVKEKKTFIGTRLERKSSSNSALFSKLNKIQQSSDYEKNTFIKGRVEVNRIFDALDLPYSLKDFTYQKFKTIRSNLKPNTKFRAPEKLVPVVIYLTMKLHDISIDENKLLEVSLIEKKDFNSFKLSIGEYYREYYGRNRKKYILRKVSELAQYYAKDFKSQNMEFYHLSSKILDRFWDQINSAPDNVVAGLVSSLSVLTAFRNTITVNKICTKLNISRKSVKYQVKKIFIDRYKISGFQTLVKSADLLKNMFIKLGLLEPEKQQEIEITH